MSVPINARKIWDLEDSRKADGGLPIETDLRGEIHPDLIRFKGWWYCGLKESPLRRMRVIRSRDGETWESVKVFSRSMDDSIGDCKFSITPDGSLMITTFAKGINQFRGEGELPQVWCASVTWLSEDGVNWGPMYACPSGHSERWMVRFTTTWFGGRGFSVCAGTGTLFVTLDGIHYRPLVDNIYESWEGPQVTEKILKTFDPNDIHQGPGTAPRQPNEADLAFDPKDGSACAIVRTHPLYAIIGHATAPDYDDWTWRPMQVDWEGDGNLRPACEKLGVQMGGPLVKYLSNGVLLAAGRADASKPGKPKGRLTLFIVDREQAVLKRWGDFDGWSHYPGVVEHEGELWISCGKQQGRDPFEVYLLRVPMPQA